MNNQWLVPQSLSGSWGSILPIISLCVKQNVKTHSTSMSHISRQHSQRYGWHPACLPQNSPLPQTTHYSGPWLSLTPPSAGKCGQCGTWSSSTNYVGVDMRNGSRRNRKREGKRATFLMTHTTLLKFVVMMAPVWFANYLRSTTF